MIARFQIILNTIENRLIICLNLPPGDLINTIFYYIKHLYVIQIINQMNAN